MAARRFADLKKVGAFLVVFGIVAPVINGVGGVLPGDAVGLSPGGAMLFGTLSVLLASATAYTAWWVVNGYESRLNEVQQDAGNVMIVVAGGVGVPVNGCARLAPIV